MSALCGIYLSVSYYLKVFVLKFYLIVLMISDDVKTMKRYNIR